MRTAERVARVGWERFLPRLRWSQGEHVTLLGPTGTGKTTLALDLLDERKWVVVFGTKPRDRTLDKLVSDRGYHVIREWPPPPAPHGDRVILWPDMRDMAGIYQQQEQFAEAMGSIYRRGAWCVYLDELRYLTETLKLAAYAEMLWQQGRSLGVSVVAGTQRPARVPLTAYDQATHLFLWRDSDKRNLDRLADLSGDLDRDLIRRVVLGLEDHECCYVNTRTGEIAITKAPAP